MLILLLVIKLRFQSKQRPATHQESVLAASSTNEDWLIRYCRQQGRQQDGWLLLWLLSYDLCPSCLIVAPSCYHGYQALTNSKEMGPLLQVQEDASQQVHVLH